jgi:hypothetical protein
LARLAVYRWAYFVVSHNITIKDGAVWPNLSYRLVINSLQPQPYFFHRGLTSPLTQQMNETQVIIAKEKYRTNCKILS